MFIMEPPFFSYSNFELTFGIEKCGTQREQTVVLDSLHGSGESTPAVNLSVQGHDTLLRLLAKLEQFSVLGKFGPRPASPALHVSCPMKKA